VSRPGCGCATYLGCRFSAPIAWAAQFPDAYQSTPETIDAVWVEIDVELHNKAALAAAGNSLARANGCHQPDSGRAAIPETPAARDLVCRDAAAVRKHGDAPARVIGHQRSGEVVV
jgi:hypothetical protein